MIDKLKENIPPIHREGFVFILIALAITLFFFMFSEVLGLIMSIISVWCICFFRDPERVAPEGEALVLSPADGKVCAIVEDAKPPKEFELKGTFNRVSIFLNIWNVHVNRMPFVGEVTKLKYHKGKFFNASLDKASVHNERQCIKLHNEEHKLDMVVVQIAGLIARRIVCDLHESQKVEAAERFGIIRFGSRVDLYLPSDIPLSVRVGQTMIGGETIICDLSNRVVKKPAKPAVIAKAIAKSPAKKSTSKASASKSVSSKAKTVLEEESK